MRFSHTLLLLALPLLLPACAEIDAQAEGDTRVTGQSLHPDSEDQSEPARPAPQPFELEVHMTGQSDLPNLQPECQVDALAGEVQATHTTTGQIDNNGLHVASFTLASAQFETPSASCAVPTADVNSLTEVTLRAAINATSQNCTTYCDAKARAHADSECSAATDEATCRSEAEAAYTGSCQTSCTSSTHRIVAETSLSAAALASINARSLAAEGLGTLNVNFSYDHIEDADGNTVEDQ